MATQEQISKMRADMVNELYSVVEKYRTDVGVSMCSSDVIGALEWVKMAVYIEATGDDLLDSTSLRLN